MSPQNEFEVGHQKYEFEVEPPAYTYRPLQLLNKQQLRFEDRFHRIVKITRLSDSRCWTGAADFKAHYTNNLTTHLRAWLEDCFSVWDLDTLPEGFEIPQGATPAAPAQHYCPEYVPRAA